jgi:hypothetical protein
MVGLDHVVRAVVDVTGGLGRRVANGAPGVGDGVARGAPGVGDGVASGAPGLGDGVAGVGHVLADGLGLSGDRGRSDQAGGEDRETEGHAVLLRGTDRRGERGLNSRFAASPTPYSAPNRARLPLYAQTMLASAQPGAIACGLRVERA